MTWKMLWWVVPFASPWMAWNLFLAAVPLGLSLVLVRSRQWPGVVQGAIALGLVAFLPNAPYVLTDLIHLVQEIQWNDSLLFNTLVLLPKYTLFVLLGFGAYVVAVLNVGHYLRLRQGGQFVVPAELALHGLSSLGVYLGRIERFNSWDLATHPGQIVQRVATDVLSQPALLFIGVGFGIIAVLYGGLKSVVTALQLQHTYRQLLQHAPPPVSSPPFQDVQLGG